MTDRDQREPQSGTTGTEPNASPTPRLMLLSSDRGLERDADDAGEPVGPRLHDERVRRALHTVRAVDTRPPGARMPAHDAGGPAEPQPAVLTGALAALRASVTMLVCARRAEGVPIQRVLPELKALVRHAEPALSGLETLTMLTEQVVRWAIEAYYDRPLRMHVTPER